ncbi:MAG: helix-turn-helix domain-containing protein [Gemmatimonadota bacterium]
MHGRDRGSAGSTDVECHVARLGFGQFYGRVVESLEVSELYVGEWTGLPPKGAERHTHEYAHFSLVVSGAYDTTTRNLEGRCPATTLLFHPAGTTHEDRFLAADGRALQISLGSSLLETFGAPRLPDHSIAFDDAQLGFPASRIRRELRSPDRFSGIAVEGLTLEMIDRVSVRVERHDARRPPWLARAVACIRERAAEPARVADVASDVGIHPVHLARVFRRHLGLSPGEYLRRSRVRTAMELLERGTEPLATVAIRSGFCDQSALTTTFRRELDTTPGAYRRTVRR